MLLFLAYLGKIYNESCIYMQSLPFIFWLMYVNTCSCCCKENCQINDQIWHGTEDALHTEHEKLYRVNIPTSEAHIGIYNYHNYKIGDFIDQFVLYFLGSWSSAEDRPWNQDAGGDRQIVGGIQTPSPDVGGGEESADVQHEDNDIHDGTSAPQDGRSPRQKCVSIQLVFIGGENF